MTQILDMCCGSRCSGLTREDNRAIYSDIRAEKQLYVMAGS
ncbi:hypothetical protein [Proteus mirabilis]